MGGVTLPISFEVNFFLSSKTKNIIVNFYSQYGGGVNNMYDIMDIAMQETAQQIMEAMLTRDRIISEYRRGGVPQSDINTFYETATLEITSAYRTAFTEGFFGSIAEKIKKFWAWFVDKIKKMWKAICNFFGSLFGKAKKKAEELKNNENAQKAGLSAGMAASAAAIGATARGGNASSSSSGQQQSQNYITPKAPKPQNFSFYSPEEIAKREAIETKRKQEEFQKKLVKWYKPFDPSKLLALAKEMTERMAGLFQVIEEYADKTAKSKTYLDPNQKAEIEEILRKFQAKEILDKTHDSSSPISLMWMEERHLYVNEIKELNSYASIELTLQNLERINKKITPHLNKLDTFRGQLDKIFHSNPEHKSDSELYQDALQELYNNLVDWSKVYLRFMNKVKTFFKTCFDTCAELLDFHNPDRIKSVDEYRRDLDSGKPFEW